MAKGAQEIEWADIQGLAFSGFGKHQASRHLFLRITKPPVAKVWIRDLLEGGFIVSASEIDDRNTQIAPPDLIVNLALTAAGLDALGLTPETLQTFPFEFQEGMTGTLRRRSMLGDVGSNAPDLWAWGHNDREPHVAAMIFARDESLLKSEELWKRLPKLDGLANVWDKQTADDSYSGDGLKTYLTPKKNEHFGFRDGISQPLIEGTPSAERRRYGPEEVSIVKAGELILGYKNERGRLPVSPFVDGDRAGSSDLPNTENGRPDLGQNGSFLVIRQLSQDVAAFEAAAKNATATEQDAARFKARLMGRWQNGAPLVRYPNAEPDLSDKNRPENDFLYDLEDQSGLNCPIGSHIRRSNPRDSLPPKPETALRLSKRRRILRRGRLYGPPPDRSDDESERGILFICLNADIADQFELIQHSWLNNPHFAGLYDESDPVAAGSRPLGAEMTIQASPINNRTPELAQFVTVRGGAYFFLPGLRALRFLARDDTNGKQEIQNG